MPRARSVGTRILSCKRSCLRGLGFVSDTIFIVSVRFARSTLTGRKLASPQAKFKKSDERIAQRRESAAGGRRALIRHDANHAGRFGETGPLDFAIRWNLGASRLFLSARKFEDMTEPRTCENSRLAFDQPATYGDLKVAGGSHSWLRGPEAPDANRDVLLRYVAAASEAAPRSDGNWRLAPLPSSVLATYLTSPKAAGLPAPPHLKLTSMGP